MSFKAVILNLERFINNISNVMPEIRMMISAHNDFQPNPYCKSSVENFIKVGRNF